MMMMHVPSELLCHYLLIHVTELKEAMRLSPRQLPAEADMFVTARARVDMKMKCLLFCAWFSFREALGHVVPVEIERQNMSLIQSTRSCGTYLGVYEGL